MDSAKDESESGRDPFANIREHCESTTMHGVRFFFIGAYWRRLIWGLLVAASLAGFLRLAIGNIIQFTDLPTTTKVSVVYPRAIEFPVVTICNLNTFIKSKVLSIGGIDLVKALESVNLYAQTIAAENETDRANKIKFLEEAGGLEKLVMDAGIDESFFGDCLWNGLPCHLYDDAFTPSLTPFGKCYSFNKRAVPYNSSGGGSLSGLTFIVDIQQNEYLNPGFFWSAGVQILVHSQAETSASILTSGFNANPGTHTSIQIRETRTKNLDQPYGDCNASNPADYSVNNCANLCYYNVLKEKCGCKELYMKEFYNDNVRICSFRDFSCINLAQDDFIVDSTCSCPPPCEERLFGIQLSQSQFPSNEGAADWTKRFNASESYTKSSLIWLDFFYPQIQYTQNEQQKSYTIANLFGDIGGNLGLFIGASILTMGEFAQYFIKEIYDACKRRRRRQKV